MKEKFKIDIDKLNRIIAQYQEKGKEKDQRHYEDLIINTLGTDALRVAISDGILRFYAQKILKGTKIHAFYSDEETLQMMEGLSNYEIVGDWQHFLTVNSEYLFELPKDMQEKFAENFSIGNHDAKECLLKLWENHIETTGTDVIRPESLSSNNNITFKCFGPDMRFMIETLRKKFAC